MREYEVAGRIMRWADGVGLCGRGGRLDEELSAPGHVMVESVVRTHPC